MIPEVITGRDGCRLAAKWGIVDELAFRLNIMSESLEFAVSIISGLRSTREQISLGRAGRPVADIDRSTHLSCPATGADVMPQIAITDVVKARLGTEGVRAGMRWGGGSPVDPRTGIPSDWNHFDLGARL